MFSHSGEISSSTAHSLVLIHKTRGLLKLHGGASAHYLGSIFFHMRKKKERK